MEDNKILSQNYEKLIVFNEVTGKEYAVITPQSVITASDMAVKLTPSQD